jgi:hypothetical protein
MSESTKPDRSILATLVKEYNSAKDFATKVTTRADELKRELTRLVKSHGLADDKGHVWLDAGEHQIKHEHRVSKSFNSSAAEQWAKELGIWDNVKETVETLSEEKLLAHVWNNPELQDKLDSFYEKKSSWAFKIVAGRSYNEDE